MLKTILENLEVNEQKVDISRWSSKDDGYGRFDHTMGGYVGIGWVKGDQWNGFSYSVSVSQDYERESAVLTFIKDIDGDGNRLKPHIYIEMKPKDIKKFLITVKKNVSKDFYKVIQKEFQNMVEAIVLKGIYIRDIRGYTGNYQPPTFVTLPKDYIGGT